MVGERGEELTKDADEDEHADDDPGGGKGTGSKPTPGYFANQFTDNIFAANLPGEWSGRLRQREPARRDKELVAIYNGLGGYYDIQTDLL